jgi:hypothetical protein
MTEENQLGAHEKAILATHACLQLVVLNARMVMHTPDCPFPLYMDMNNTQFAQFNKFLGIIHDNKVSDLSVLEPYFRIYK